MQKEEIVSHSWAPHARQLTQDDIGKKIVKTKPTKSKDYSYSGGEADSVLLLAIEFTIENGKEKILTLTIESHGLPCKLKEEEFLCDWVVLEEVKNIPFDKDYISQRSIENEEFYRETNFDVSYSYPSPTHSETQAKIRANLIATFNSETHHSFHLLPIPCPPFECNWDEDEKQYQRENTSITILALDE